MGFRSDEPDRAALRHTTIPRCVAESASRPSPFRCQNQATSGLNMSIAPPVERLNAILARHDIVMATLNAGPDTETFVSLSRELAELDPVVAAIRAYQA